MLDSREFDERLEIVPSLDSWVTRRMDDPDMMIEYAKAHWGDFEEWLIEEYWEEFGSRGHD